jgi:DNA replication and repair protein RecF
VEGSETRRKFMDSVIQLDSHYLQQLIQYQKVMSQRNALLKYFALNHVLIPIHSIYNEQLNGFGAYIFEKRKEFINHLFYFQHASSSITGSQETVQLVYESHLYEKTY